MLPPRVEPGAPCAPDDTGDIRMIDKDVNEYVCPERVTCTNNITKNRRKTVEKELCGSGGGEKNEERIEDDR